ncbi:MAG: DUF4124 domain-containing protein [Pseudomonadota bacterium]
MTDVVRPALSMLVAIAAALAAPRGVCAQPYKWVDERGVVNYGDAPPANANGVRQLDAANVPLSIVPGLAREVIERERERALEARVAELRREVEELRARASAPVIVPVPVVRESPVIVAHPLRLHGHRFDKARPHPPRDAPVRGRPVQRSPAAMRADLPR